MQPDRQQRVIGGDLPRQRLARSTRTRSRFPVVGGASPVRLCSGCSRSARGIESSYAAELATIRTCDVNRPADGSAGASACRCDARSLQSDGDHPSWSWAAGRGGVDVDFLRRTVHIEWQLSQDGKRRVPPKTPRSRRTLPLPSVVAEALAAHVAEFPPAVDGSLFTTANGNLWRQEHHGARVFTPAVRGAGLPAGTTSHDLRHHCASVLLAAGESVVPGRRAVGPRERDLSAQDLRPPHARQRGPDAAGHRHRVVYE